MFWCYSGHVGVDESVYHRSGQVQLLGDRERNVTKWTKRDEPMIFETVARRAVACHANSRAVARNATGFQAVGERRYQKAAEI